MNLARRVVARHVLAGYIPDKFWRDQKAKLKEIVGENLSGHDPSSVRWRLRDRLLPFYKEFGKSLIAFGVGEAEATINDRVENVEHVINKVCEALDKFDEEINGSFTWPIPDAENEVAWAIAVEIKEIYRESVKRVADGMKAMWRTDRRLIQNLAKRLLSKATPEERQAVEASAKSKDTFDTQHDRIKFAFYNRVGLNASAKRLISKEVVRYDLLKWLDFLREVLIANYTGEAAENRQFRNFDLHGMKVVVDDTTVTPNDIARYVDYLRQAHALLRAKGLLKVWYGTVFIRCRECGGVNYNTGGGVGGNYPIGPDVVNVFERPSGFIVELMAHELGHRYWFKLMTPSQRARFESLVKVRHAPKPKDSEPKLVGTDKADDAKKAIDAAIDEVRKAIAAFRISMLRAKRVSDGIRKQTEAILEPASRNIVNAFIEAFYKTTVSADGPETKRLFNAALQAADKIRSKLWDSRSELQKKLNDEPEPAGPIENLDRYWLDVLRKILPVWLKEADGVINEASAAAHTYIDAVIQEHNTNESTANERRLKRWQEIEDADTRPVTPVSDYGKSNIDEAFAEVFAHYVIGYDMSQDQIESFKTVLKTAGERVLERYKAGL